MRRGEHERAVRILLLVIALILMLQLTTGCANTSDRAFYGQTFIGVRLTESGGFESCSKENSGMRLGHEWRIKENWKIAAEYEHVSHTLCGSPFNGKTDSYTDHAGLTLTYGGLK